MNGSARLSNRQIKSLSFLTALSTALLAVSYFAFVYYVRSTTRELVSGWAQTEAISLQEGNYLNAVAKNQRLIMASDFVRGVSLESKARRIFAEFGDTKHAVEIHFGASNQSVIQVGIFSFVGLHRVGGPSDLYAVFWVEPRYASWIFGGYAATVIGLSIVFLIFVQRMERREAFERERIIRSAINELIGGGGPSRVLLESVPTLVRSWAEVTKELDAEKERAAGLLIQARLGELARQVSHDIRSPLSALNMMVGALKELPEDKLAVIRGAAGRINDIANDLLAKSRGESKTEESTLLSNFLEGIISEKRIQYQGLSGIEIVGPDWGGVAADHSLRVRISEATLARIVSNLVNNSVDACGDLGRIVVSVRLQAKDVVLIVSDNGKGISPELLSRLGERGVSLGKEGTGNGLGLAHAKEGIEAAGGRFLIQSRLSHGTMVTMSLPIA